MFSVFSFSPFSHIFFSSVSFVSLAFVGISISLALLIKSSQIRVSFLDLRLECAHKEICLRPYGEMQNATKMVKWFWCRMQIAVLRSLRRSAIIALLPFCWMLLIAGVYDISSSFNYICRILDNRSRTCNHQRTCFWWANRAKCSAFTMEDQ